MNAFGYVLTLEYVGDYFIRNRQILFYDNEESYFDEIFLISLGLFYKFGFSAFEIFIWAPGGLEVRIM